MSIALESATDFRQLLEGPDDGPYAYSQLFHADTWRARRLSKRKFTLLRRIDTALRPMLEQGERVLYLSRGTAVSFAESVMAGWLMYYLNRRAIVVTDRRILLLHIGAYGHPKDYRSEIRYGAVARLDRTLLGKLKFRFRDGSTRVFAGVARRDRGVLHALINEISGTLVDAAPASTRLHDLCPHCYRAVRERTNACPDCRGAFKSPNAAALLSLMFPGFGDFYLGHRFLAVLEIATVGILWIAMIAVVAEDPTTGPMMALGIALFVVIWVHGFDALFTAYIGRRGIIAARAPVGRGRYVAAAVPMVLVVGAIGMTSAGKGGLAPGAVAIVGDSLPARQEAALRKAGYLGPTERVLGFYSNGTATILEDGNFFTRERVVSYAYDYEQPFHRAARYENVVDLHIVFAESASVLTEIYVVPEDPAGAFYLVVSPAGGGDTAFVVGLYGTWRAAREALGEGVWYDGGNGNTPDTPIVIRGAADLPTAVDAMYRWIGFWLGPRGEAWDVARERGVQAPLGLVHEVTLRRSADESLTLYFDLVRGRVPR